jgi:hypothetical protein
MKVSKKMSINIIDLIRNIERNSAMWEVDIVEEFIEFVNKDTHVITMIREMLISRLKYSTGRLYNSISIQAYEGKGGRENSFTEYKNVNVFLTIETKNKDAINALIGEAESRKPIAEPPSILAMTKWIRGKRKFFDKSIQAIRDRQSDVIRALAQRQRNAMIDENDEAEPLNVPERLTALRDREYQDPVYHLAKIIRGRMIKRIAKGLQPTKGSEYVFLGNYPEYEGAGSRSSFAPKYNKLATPLLTTKLRQKVVGDINTFMAKIVEEYYNRIIQKYIRKGLAGELLQESHAPEREGMRRERTGSLDVTISGQLKSLTKEQSGVIVAATMKLINKIAEIVEESPGSNRTKAKSAWLKQSRAAIMTAIDDLFPAMNKQANEASKYIFVKLKETRKGLRGIKGFVPPPVKRRAIRFERKK